MNGRIRFLAYAYIALCGGAIAVGLVILIGLAFEPNAGQALAFIGMPFLLLSLFYFIPGLVGAFGLLRGATWARTVITVLSVLVLFAIPVGTIWGGWGLWVLRGSPDFPRRPTPRERSARVELRPFDSEERSRVTGILLAMAAVASLFVVMIGTGSRITHDTRITVDATYYYAALAVLIGLTAYGIRAWMRAPSTIFTGYGFRFGENRVFATPREAKAIHDRRLAELQADPVKRKYIERFERGEYWSDEQIAYAEDRSRLATCPHLQPIEAAMRAAGIETRLTNLCLRSPCCVDKEALGERFELPDSVHYTEMHVYDRSIHDPPVAFIQCDLCRSLIDVIHPSNAAPGTPWFPSKSVA